MIQKLLFAAFLCVAVAPAADAQTPATSPAGIRADMMKMPRGDWLYDVLKQLQPVKIKGSALIDPVPDRELTRREFAAFTAQALEKMVTCSSRDSFDKRFSIRLRRGDVDTGAVLKPKRDFSLRQRGPFYEMMAYEVRHLLGALVREFRAELRQMQMPEAVLEQIAPEKFNRRTDSIVMYLNSFR